MHSASFRVRCRYRVATTRKKSKERTRRKLIQASLGLSAKKGFTAVSLREVAGAAGITPAAFYRHFKSMDELGVAVLDEVALSLRQLLRGTRERFRGTDKIVEATVDSFLEYVSEHRLLFHFFVSEWQGSSELFRNFIQEELDLFKTELREDLQSNHGSKLRNVDPIAEVMAATVFAMGARALWVKGKGQVILRNKMIDSLRLVLEGALCLR